MAHKVEATWAAKDGTLHQSELAAIKHEALGTLGKCLYYAGTSSVFIPVEHLRVGSVANRERSARRLVSQLADYGFVVIHENYLKDSLKDG